MYADVELAIALSTDRKNPHALSPLIADLYTLRYLQYLDVREWETLFHISRCGTDHELMEIDKECNHKQYVLGQMTYKLRVLKRLRYEENARNLVASILFVPIDIIPIVIAYMA
jgi:hypothetical protein